MKIGFFTDGYLPQPNGVAISVHATAKALKKLGHEVYIIAPKYPRYKDREKNVFRLTSMKLYEKADIRMALAIPDKPLRQVLKIDFDIIHGHAGGPATFLGWEIAKVKNIPFVGTYHTLWNRYTHYILGGKLIKPRLMEIATRVFGNLTDTLVAPTGRVKKELVRYGVKKPIVVIPSGLDFSELSTKKGHFKRKIGLNDNDKILLFVGRIGTEKSIDFLVKVIHIFSKKNPNVYLVLVGEGPEKENLKRLAKRLNVQKRVIFAGLVPHEDIYNAYNDADLFVFASQTETQGLVIIEALACGTPVVAVKDEAFLNIVKNGENGFLVDRNTAEFAKKVEFVISNPKLREKLSKEAKVIAQTYSANTTARKLIHLYEKVIKEHKVKRRISDQVKAKMSDLKKFFTITDKVNKFKEIITS